MDVEAVYSRYADYIETVFRMELAKMKRTGIYISREDEEDVHQHVLYKLVRYLPRHNPAKSHIKTYIYTIVKTNLRWKLIDMRGMSQRKPTRESFNNGMLHYDDPDAGIPEPEMHDAIPDFLDPDQREFCSLVAEEGMSRAEAFEAMGIPEEERKPFLEAIRAALSGH